MKRKYLLILVIFILSISVVACGNEKEEVVEEEVVEEKVVEEKVVEEKVVEEEVVEEEVVEEKVVEEKVVEEEVVEEEVVEEEKYETGITYEDLARDKDGLKGEYVKFNGIIMQVFSSKTEYKKYTLAINGNFDEVVYIAIHDNLLEQNILRDDNITIEGYTEGNVSTKTVQGAERQVPFIMVDNLYQ